MRNRASVVYNLVAKRVHARAMADLLHPHDIAASFVHVQVNDDGDFSFNGRSRWVAYKSRKTHGNARFLYNFGYFVNAQGKEGGSVLPMEQGTAKDTQTYHVKYRNMYQYAVGAAPPYLDAVDIGIGDLKKDGVKGVAFWKGIIGLWAAHKPGPVVMLSTSPVSKEDWVRNPAAPAAAAAAAPTVNKNNISVGTFTLTGSGYTYSGKGGTEEVNDEPVMMHSSFYVARLPPQGLPALPKFVATPMKVGIMYEYGALKNINALVSRALCGGRVYTTAAVAATTCAEKNPFLTTCYVTTKDDAEAGDNDYEDVPLVRVVNTAENSRGSSAYSLCKRAAHKLFATEPSSVIQCVCATENTVQGEPMRFRASPDLGYDIVQQNDDTLIELTAAAQTAPSRDESVVAPLDKHYTMHTMSTDPAASSRAYSNISDFVKQEERKWRNVFIFSNVYNSLSLNDKRALDSKYQVYSFSREKDTGVHPVSVN
jgi:hypothetical protein